MSTTTEQQHNAVVTPPSSPPYNSYSSSNGRLISLETVPAAPLIPTNQSNEYYNPPRSYQQAQHQQSSVYGPTVTATTAMPSPTSTATLIPYIYEDDQEDEADNMLKAISKAIQERDNEMLTEFMDDWIVEDEKNEIDNSSGDRSSENEGANKTTMDKMIIDICDDDEVVDMAVESEVKEGEEIEDTCCQDLDEFIENVRTYQKNLRAASAAEADSHGGAGTPCKPTNGNETLTKIIESCLISSS